MQINPLAVIVTALLELQDITKSLKRSYHSFYRFRSTRQSIFVLLKQLHNTYTSISPLNDCDLMLKCYKCEKVQFIVKVIDVLCYK